MGASAVRRLTQTLLEGSRVFMVRYFTTIPLLKRLTEKKIHETGIIIKSRLQAAVHFTNKKILNRLGRGASEQTVRLDNKINVVQWYDFKPVVLASTILQDDPTDVCKWWSKIQKKYLEVRRPNIVEYNESTGRIDLAARAIAYLCVHKQIDSKYNVSFLWSSSGEFLDFAQARLSQTWF